MMCTSGAQSALDMLFLWGGHSGAGLRAPVLTLSLSGLTTTHCRLFFVQDGGCSCPGDVAKAFGKDGAWCHPLHPAQLQHRQQ